MATTDVPMTPPNPASPRFTIELEFVLALANPYYLSHLAVTFPHLLSEPASASSVTKRKNAGTQDTPAQKFAAYVKYLHTYWKDPEYCRFLTHPGATLRALELLQQEKFRKEIIMPSVIEGLLMSHQQSENHIQIAIDADANDGKDATVGGPEIKAEATPT